jgi:hypothetical protein
MDHTQSPWRLGHDIDAETGTLLVIALLAIGVVGILKQLEQDAACRVAEILDLATYRHKQVGRCLGVGDGMPKFSL